MHGVGRMRGRMTVQEKKQCNAPSPPSAPITSAACCAPRALKEARAKRERGEITPEQLKAIEDREIETLIRKQEAVGLKSITDGENRRKSWQTDFIAALPGIETYQGKRKVAFQGGVQPQQILVRVARQARRLRQPPDDRAFQVPQGAHQGRRRR